jgi:phenylpropionate dioxygenase-like ring-hydroxylating dioxygenase large terminal subunit
VRGHDGRLRALSNVCRHRLFPVVEDQAGSAGWLTCRYHLWKYGLDGHLAGAPHMHDTPGFEPAQCGLPELALEEWLGFVFVSLAAEPEPLAPRLAGLEQRFAHHDLGRAVTVAEYRKVWAGNWKLGVENGSESYHHTGIHAATVEPYLPSRGTYLEMATDDWALHRTPLLAEVATAYGFRLDRPSALDADDRAAMKVATVFPGFLLLTIADFVQWVSWIPLSVDRTEVLSEALFPQEVLDLEDDAAALRAVIHAGIHAVNSEDEHATVVLQRAASSRRATRGPLGSKEAVLPRFHGYLARRLGTPPR